MKKCKSLISILLVNMYLFCNINFAVAGDLIIQNTTLSPQIVLNLADIQNLFSGLNPDSKVTLVTAATDAEIPENYKQEIGQQFFVDAVDELLSSRKALDAIGPAFFIYGSARFNPGHKWYEQAKRFGRMVAEYFISLITGGGPGTMLGANEGAYGINGVDSIGLCMLLPHEKNNDHKLFKNVVIIFNYFFIRKIMFIQKTSGGMSLPGGLGTLDEIFEIFAFNKRFPEKARYNVLVDQAFYSGLLKFLDKIHQSGLMPYHEELSLTIKDSVEEAFDYLISKTGGLKSQELDIDAKVFRQELFRASRLLNRVGPSVGIIGGAQMPEDSVYWPMARRLAGSLGSLNINILRRGNRGIAAAVGQAYDDFHKTHPIEKGMYIALHEDGKQIGDNSTDLSLNFENYFSLKIALIEYSKLGLVVFPGGIDVLDVIFNTLCLIKTKKIAPMPIILVGRDIWEPLIEWMKAEMVSAGTINTDYLDLIQIVDNEIEAQRIIQDNLALIKKNTETDPGQIKKRERLAHLLLKQKNTKAAFKRIFTEELTPISLARKNDQFNFALIAQAI
ncbi:MAG: LOG family protein [Candidatus Omnitrophota bacterium]